MKVYEIVFITWDVEGGCCTNQRRVTSKTVVAASASAAAVDAARACAEKLIGVTRIQAWSKVYEMI